MNPLRNLERALSEFGASALKGGFAEPAEMRRYARELEQRFGAPPDKPRPDRREPALRRLLSGGKLESTRDLKYICYGVADPIGPQKQRVLSNPNAFAALLRHLQALENAPTRLRRCYLGLLSAYFEFDGRRSPDEVVKAHWDKVRVYLARHLETIASTNPVPEWAHVLKEHRNLLEVKPCERYAKKLLNGQPEEFDGVRQALSISGNSWVVHDAAFAAIEAACEEGESTFLSRLPALMDLMNRHPVIQSPALGVVLQKYAQMRNRPEHRPLCQFAVSLWHNPLFKKNLKNWDVAGPAATAMVSLWLTSSLIEDFFELLSEDSTTDKRRVKFWQRYVEAIDDNNMYFALGRRALFDSREDIRRVRNTMGDNLLRLEGGAPTNNGFFLVIGGHVIAEFGEKDNAAFIFKRERLPFELKGSVSGLGRRQWRNFAEARLRHIDHSNTRWEEDFESSLWQIAGLHRGPEDRFTAGGTRCTEADATRCRQHPELLPTL